MDSKADVLIYGMGEKQIREIAEALDKDQLQKRLPAIKGICYVANTVPENAIECPSYEAISADKEIFAKAFKMQFDEQDPYYGKTVAQGHGNRYIVQNSPALPLT